MSTEQQSEQMRIADVNKIIKRKLKCIRTNIEKLLNNFHTETGHAITINQEWSTENVNNKFVFKSKINLTAEILSAREFDDVK